MILNGIKQIKNSKGQTNSYSEITYKQIIRFPTVKIRSTPTDKALAETIEEIKSNVEC